MFLIIFIILLSLFSIAGCKVAEEIEKEESLEITLISPAEVYEIITNDEDYIILDVRNQDEYNEGHLGKALLIPVDELGERIDELNENKPIIVYCRSGVRSSIAASILIENGFTQVYDMGGILDWQEEGFPIIVEERAVSAIELITVDEAYEIFLEDKNYLFLDARSKDKYDSNHIEGAINIPLAEIENRLDEIPVDRLVIVYCDCTDHCNKSEPAAKILMENGFNQVNVIEGRAFSDWEEKGYPIAEE